MGMYPDIGGCSSVLEVWYGESYFLVLEMLGGMVYCGFKIIV